jgi:hypothetical protein
LKPFIPFFIYLLIAITLLLIFIAMPTVVFAAAEHCHSCALLDAQIADQHRMKLNPIWYEMTAYKDVQGLEPVRLVVVYDYEHMPFIDGACKGASGCWVSTTQTIWIVKDAMSYGSRDGFGIGCSTLYHELLHSYGYDHSYMEIHYPDSRCAVK